MISNQCAFRVRNIRPTNDIKPREDRDANLRNILHVNKNLATRHDVISFHITRVIIGIILIFVRPPSIAIISPIIPRGPLINQQRLIMIAVRLLHARAARSLIISLIIRRIFFAGIAAGIAELFNDRWQLSARRGATLQT